MSRDIIHIAADYLKGSLNDADRKYFLTWLDKSDDNKMLFEELKRVWELTGCLSHDLKPDVDKEWLRFTGTRPRFTDVNSARPRNLNDYRRKLLRVAAILIPVVVLLSVLYFSKKHDSEWITVSTNIKRIELDLPDGSKVWLNNKSRISYPKKFVSKSRIVNLEGEAFFEVTHNGAPFIVETASKTEVKVLGTQFNVRCYPMEKNTEVIVKEGRVLFSNSLNKKINTTLSQGENAVISSVTGKIEKKHEADLNLLAWKDQTFSFRNSKLSEIKTVMERYYQKPLVIPPALDNCLFSGDFVKPDLSEMLNVISISLSCNYQIKNDTIFFSGQGCGKK